MTTAEFDKIFNLPFTEASRFFQEKLNIPTKEWTDLWEGEHAKGFMSAGAYQADLLADLRKMTQKAIDGGIDIREFRKQFRPLVEKYGWQLKGGGPAWRSDLIWRTNIATAYAAGRWQQFEKAGIKYLRYVHADGVRYPRPHHQAMHGTVRPTGDVFWDRNYPPQGFRCHCRAVPVTQKEYDATPDKLKQLPQGWETAADEGWGYNVGKEGQKGYEALAKKFETLPVDIAREWMKGFVYQPQFQQFVDGKIKGNFPVAVLDEKAREAIGAKSQAAWLSDDSLSKNKGEQPERSKGHPELTLADYQKLPEVIGNPLIVVEKEGYKEVFAGEAGRYYLAVVKTTTDKAELFVQSFRKASMADIRREMKTGTVIVNKLKE